MLPAGFDRVPPRHVTVLSCVSNPSQHTHNTLYIPLRPSLTCHSSMPRRPIRRRLMRHGVTHLRMHDKVLLDFPVATVCRLRSLLNTHEHVLAPTTHFHTLSYVSYVLRVWQGLLSQHFRFLKCLGFGCIDIKTMTMTVTFLFKTLEPQ